MVFSSSSDPAAKVAHDPVISRHVVELADDVEILERDAFELPTCLSSTDPVAAFNARPAESCRRLHSRSVVLIEEWIEALTRGQFGAGSPQVRTARRSSG
jgi:hypothetical protein